MKLEWMETHRSLIEKMIRCGNIYAYTFHKQRSFGTESMFSVSQIQTLEYIIETEESDEKMPDMARRLGVSKATLIFWTRRIRFRRNILNWWRI